jgi:putative nucleotidyltransferase with HDIG domain
MIPGLKECFDLMDHYEMPEHIRAHSLMVARVAHLIVKRLHDLGAPVSVGKATAAALIHDIGKNAALETGQDHAALGRRICLEHHLWEVADIVGEHVRLREYRPQGELTEKEIVYYSDKRVNHDRIVSLGERLAYILERYAGGQEEIRRRILANFEMCREVEERLLHGVKLKPEDISVLAVGEDLDY